MTQDKSKPTDTPDFDWVAAYWRCLPKNVFLDLIKSIEDNVSSVNKVLAPGCKEKSRKPFCYENGGRLLTVYRRKDEASVSFELDGNYVRVSSDDGPLFCFAIEWDRENSECYFRIVEWERESSGCYFRIDRERLSRWRVSEKALHSLFFEV